MRRCNSPAFDDPCDRIYRKVTRLRSRISTRVPMEQIQTIASPLEEVIRRVRAEYLEMPGLQLTVAQAARLWQLDLVSSEALLSTLVQSRFLIKTRSEAYARP
jgi:hypothetical protein